MTELLTPRAKILLTIALILYCLYPMVVSANDKSSNEYGYEIGKTSDIISKVISSEDDQPSTTVTLGNNVSIDLGTGSISDITIDQTNTGAITSSH